VGVEDVAGPNRGDAPGQDPGFARALEGLRETGASVTIRHLVELLAAHGAEEGRILAEYEHVSSSVSDPAARYLIDLIMEDERRHHRTLVELATAMAWDTTSGAETTIPPLGWHLDERLLAATRRLREYEEKDRRELLALRKMLRPFEETTLWGLMVELVLLDTEKHATILKFLEHHARGD
jgi:rubrerythrin